MFSKIRNRLTRIYAVVMVLFLLAFILTTYASLLWVIYREEQQDILAFAHEEAREHVAILLNNNYPKAADEEDEDELRGHIISYILDTNWQEVEVNPADSQLRTAVKEKIRTWQKPNGETALVRIHLPNGQRAVLLMCSVGITDGNRVLGTLYAGKDITRYYGLLKTSLVVLSVVSLIFLLIATAVGHVLAGRAIIPIKNSFQRQREFAADASHELRTPLSVMLMSVDAVQADEHNRISHFSARVLKDMKSEINRMTKLVSDLLTLARADAGAIELVKEKFELYDVAKRVVRSFEPLAVYNGVQLDFAGPGNLVFYADKERIKQLLVILIDNAIKYTPRGGNVSLAIRKCSANSGELIELIIKDTGVGISQEQLPRIFERFYRIDKARSREEGGVGLGLSIAEWIARVHGGAISVQSEKGAGSTFIVTLPNS